MELAVSEHNHALNSVKCLKKKGDMTKKNEHYMTNENLNNCEKGTLGLRVLKHLIAIHRETAQEERMSYEE